MTRLHNSKRSKTVFIIVTLGLSLTSFLSAKYGETLVWPTPNTKFLENSEPETYLQPTASGRLVSAEWGCTRNGGRKFHEGIDLKATRKTAKGEAKDPIGCIADGKVVHISRNTGDSNYGKYIVISHQMNGLEWCSLYAHLNSIRPNIKVGMLLRAGEKIGTMGNTSSNIKIPTSRSHLHFEIVLRTNSRFQNWYNQQDYTSINKHASWNGMNLIGVNPFKFYQYVLDNPEKPFSAFFTNEPVAFEVLTYFEQRPDFLERNPIFLRGKQAQNRGHWYNIGFTWYGAPVNWTPVPEHTVNRSFSHSRVYVRNLRYEKPCRNFVNEVNGRFEATTLLTQLIDQLKVH